MSHMLAPEWRLKDLRAAEISTLPTRRRRNWSRAWSAGSALAVVWTAYLAASERPLFALVAAVLAVSTRVLILRGADGRLVRFNIHSVWAKEAQWVFDVVASISNRPPAFLAARWISPA